MTSIILVPWIVGLLASPCHCGAQERAKQDEEKVNVTVVVILASERCTVIDPCLKDIAPEFQKKDPSLKGFSVVSMSQVALPPFERAVIPCVENATVVVVVKKCVDKDDMVCLAVTAPLQDEIVYRAVCDKFFPIITRYQNKEHVPPMWVAKAFGQAVAGGPVIGPLLGCNTLLHGRCRARLILAIRAQACTGK